MSDLSGHDIGRYHLLEQLGEGGMAIVYKAYDTRLEREVAVKIIRKGAFPLEMLDEMLKRFEREAKSLARLSHPNIVKVHDFGEHEGSPYLVLEYLPGGTLKTLLGKPMAWQDALHLLLPIARGVEYAHRHGIIHRDIKPSNILITESGEPMLSDFGIAKILEREQATALTGSGMAVGTPEYMAPEQWTGTTSQKSDLYSLGIVLYEMIVGRKPYMADTPAAVLIKQATEPLPRPSQFEPDLPESLEWMLIKALAKDPEDRYANMSEFVQAMEGLLGLPAGSSSATAHMATGEPSQERPSYPPQPVSAKAPVSQPVKRPLPPTSSSTQTPVPRPAPRSRRWMMPTMLTGAAVLICTILGCLAVMIGPSVIKKMTSVPSPTVIIKNTLTAPAKPTVVKTTSPTRTPPPTIPPIAAVPVVPTESSLYFTEYFKNGLDNWESSFLGTGDSGMATIDVRNGKLTFELSSRQIYAYYFYKPQSYSKVRLKLQASNRGKNSNNISLVCHKSKQGWYEFSVGNDGLWYLYFQKDGDYTIIVEGGSNDINMGRSVNVYEMTCNENKISLGVNGVTLKSFTEKEYALSNGQVGMNVSSIESVPVITEVDWLDIAAP